MYDIVEKLLAERGITATKLARELGFLSRHFPLGRGVSIFQKLINVRKWQIISE